MNKQETLMHYTYRFVKDIMPNKLRGVTSEWKKDTVYITFYFDGNISEDDRDEADEASTEVIAQYSEGFLNENFVRWDRPKELPKSEYWALKRD